MTNRAFNLDDVAARIETRLVEMGLSARDASLQIGGKTDVIRNILRGAKKDKPYSPRADTVSKVANFLGRSQEWLLYGEEQAAPARAAPALPVTTIRSRAGRLNVFSSAEGGEGALILSPAPIDTIGVPEGLDGVEGAYAILFTGESMFPAIKPGQIGWVDPRLPPMRGEEHILLSSRPDLGEERAMVKDLVSWTADKWRVHQWNPDKEFDLKREQWQRCHRLIGKLNRR